MKRKRTQKKQRLDYPTATESTLPNEMVEHILSFVKCPERQVYANTSKRWKQIAQSKCVCDPEQLLVDFLATRDTYKFLHLWKLSKQYEYVPYLKLFTEALVLLPISFIREQNLDQNYLTANNSVLLQKACHAGNHALVTYLVEERGLAFTQNAFFAACSSYERDTQKETEFAYVCSKVDLGLMKRDVDIVQYLIINDLCAVLLYLVKTRPRFFGLHELYLVLVHALFVSNKDLALSLLQLQRFSLDKLTANDLACFVRKDWYTCVQLIQRRCSKRNIALSWGRAYAVACCKQKQSFMELLQPLLEYIDNSVFCHIVRHNQEAGRLLLLHHADLLCFAEADTVRHDPVVVCCLTEEWDLVYLLLQREDIGPTGTSRICILVDNILNGKKNRTKLVEERNQVLQHLMEQNLLVELVRNFDYNANQLLLQICAYVYESQSKPLTNTFNQSSLYLLVK